MIFLPLGATDEIGASCHYLEAAGTGLVLDAGMDPEEDGFDAVPPFSVLDDGRPLDHAVITHAHHDHLGSVPVLVSQFPHLRVHLTPATMMLAERLLPASARLQARRQREGSSAAPPVFDEATAEAISYVFEPHRLDTDFDLTGLHASEPVTGRFYHAGHVLGAVGLELRFDEGGRARRVFYTSDTNLQNQTIQPGADLPLPGLDVLILEATLGADPEAETASRKQHEKELGEAIARTLGRGGVALIPVFALGRAQEIVALVDRYKRRGIVPADTPVYTTGSMRAMADVYDKTRYSTPRLDEDFEVFGVEQRRLPRSRARENEALAEPSIHIASSGMMFERTLSNNVAQRIVEDEKNGIFLVGYSVPHAPAARLLEAAAAREATGEAEVVLAEERGPQPLRAEVKRFRFSGHSHRRDLLKLVDETQPKTVVLVHGEAAAKTWMADNIRFFHPEIEVLTPAQGETIEV